jgi:hypothetical protein
MISSKPEMSAPAYDNYMMCIVKDLITNSTKGPKALEKDWSHQFELDFSKLNYTEESGSIEGLGGQE